MRIPALVLTCLLMMVQAAFAAGGNYYHSKEHGYSITFPEGWEIEEHTDGQGVNASTDGGNNMNIMVLSFEKNLGGRSLDDMPDKVIWSLKEQTPDIRKVKSGTTSVGGLPALWEKVEYSMKGIKFRGTIVLFARGDEFYLMILQVAQARFDEIDPLCRKSLESFRFDDEHGMADEREYRSRKHADNSSLSGTRSNPGPDGKMPYKNAFYGYRMVFPADTDIDVSDEPGGVFAVIEGGYVVRVNAVAADETLSQNELMYVAEMYVSQVLKSEYPDIRIMEKGNTSLGGEPAVWYVTMTTGDSSGNANQYKTFSMITMHDNALYQLECMMKASDYNDLRGKCQNVYDSFRFE